MAALLPWLAWLLGLMLVAILTAWQVQVSRAAWRTLTAYRVREPVFAACDWADVHPTFRRRVEQELGRWVGPCQVFPKRLE